jgi:hypothetical protein
MSADLHPTVQQLCGAVRLAHEQEQVNGKRT